MNFGKATKLTTAEALAAALYIGGFKDHASRILSIFKWGHTFLEINNERLNTYAQSGSSGQVVEAQKHFMDNTEEQDLSPNGSSE